MRFCLSPTVAAGYASIAVLLCASLVSAQSDLCPTRETPVGPVSAARTGSLFCIDLVPVPEHAQIRALLELHSVAAGATISVARAGYPRYRLVAVIDSLPPLPGTGQSRGFVAWATTLAMDTVIRLGEVKTGRTELGELQLDQFRIFVSAEPNVSARQRTGRPLLRGTSPSARLMAHRDVTQSGPMGNAPLVPDAVTHQHRTWLMPPMDPRMPLMPGMHALRPNVEPYLPASPDTARIPFAQPRRVIAARDGDTIHLEAGLVRRRIAGKTFLMFGFNQQYPGPLIQVRQRTTIHVDLRNSLDQPTTIHWHGIRLDNRFDGVPHLTQDPVLPGQRFLYTVHFPDAGIYWYHSHYREDVQQDLGLYGNLLVDAERADAYGPVHRSEFLMLDDLLVGDAGLIPFGVDTPTHALMGRFGNVFLVNGEPLPRLHADRGEVVRFFLTNVSNARPFNVSMDGARMKLVGSDVGRYEREEWVESVVLAPAERAIVDLRFDRPGLHALVNRVRALNHAYGTYYQEIDTLALVDVRASPALPDLRTAFAQLRTNADVVREMDAYRSDFARPPDRELVLSMQVRQLPAIVAAMATGFPVPVDWNDGMAMMNWATTGNNVTWIVRDAQDRRENMDVLWTFRRGDRVRLRIVNDHNVFHAMAHPIHLHGQRLLVIRRNGTPTSNLVWKDTALVQAGESVELLVEMTNPGRWMLHCHIAE
ncbi:MAG: multicopper oxidase family protein, partial [Longimicrobiales bacterium]